MGVKFTIVLDLQDDTSGGEAGAMGVKFRIVFDLQDGIFHPAATPENMESTSRSLDLQDGTSAVKPERWESSSD